MLIGIIGLVVSVIVSLFKLYMMFRQPVQRTPSDDLADHFDAIDRMDPQAFARRRRRHLGKLLSRRMSGDADSSAN